MISDYIYDNAADTLSTLSRHIKLRYYSPESIVGHRPLSCIRLCRNPEVSIDMSVWCDPGKRNKFSYVLDSIALVLTVCPGSPAAISGAVCTKPSLPSDNGSAAFAHVNSWIQECFQNHETCKSTISNDIVDEIHGPELPTRVLDVGVIDNSDVSLVETEGRHGNFCALSYCWGPVEHNLRTTTENIQSHLSGIKFGMLPKTFQDAVITTRKIGIRYLWIDSLCIIQGHQRDWNTEAAQMGEVYQNAYLVIAASGAAHPGEGCFSNRYRCSTSVEVPYFSEAGQTMGSIRLSMRIPEDESPFWGPLFQRGWAVQEWCLARRTLFFMPAGISWKCRDLELGERCPFDMQLYPEWGSILQRYSDCLLTYKEDRLIALEGLAMAFQKARGDRYKLGVFESDLSGQLLWMAVHHINMSEDLPNVPSWSWASKGGSKTFWTEQGIVKEPMIDCAHMAIEESGALRVEGLVRECRTSSAKVIDVHQTNSDGLQSLPSIIHVLRQGHVYWIESLSAPFGVVGVAAFDNEYFEKIHLMFLNKLDTKEFKR
jgi:hypothetical protein